MNPVFILLPIISALIGWLTNRLAIWMLFNPKEPIRLLGYTWQGIFIKSQRDIALKIGDLVADNLLTKNMLEDKIFNQSNKEEALRFLTTKISGYLGQDLKEDFPLASWFVRSKHKERITQALSEKINESWDEVHANFPEYLENNVNIRQLVSDKILTLESDDINDMMHAVLEKELRFIEIVGAVLGFVIGLVQLSITFFL